MTDQAWSVIVPVKGTAAAKSRLGAESYLADALALDTVAAAVRTGAHVIVVTPESSRLFDGVGVSLIADPGTGLLDAISCGLQGVEEPRPTAVLLGDLPALAPTELASALGSAERFPRAFVSDAGGTGTTLITAMPPARHDPRFGVGSRARHLSVGYAELLVPADSGLRCDVDTVRDLAAIRSRLGPATSHAMSVPHRNGGASVMR